MMGLKMELAGFGISSELQSISESHHESISEAAEGARRRSGSRSATHHLAKHSMLCIADGTHQLPQ